MRSNSFDLTKIIKPHILSLQPYSSARDEFEGDADIYLDANENPFGSVGLSTKFNRYPDPHHRELKQKIAETKNVSPEQIFIGNGSDEAIDLLMRACCDSTVEIMSFPPTYGMYDVSAKIYNTQHREILLRPDFSLDMPAILATVSDKTRMVFICNPNNPTGNSFSHTEIKTIAAALPSGFLIADEAYIDFSNEDSALQLLSEVPNLVILQTFSKAWGLAGLRCGIAFAAKEIIAVLHKIKPPYNINSFTLTEAKKALASREIYEENVREILLERAKLATELIKFSFVEKVFPSQANFLLVKVKNADELYHFLLKKRIIVRNRSRQALCENCVRITIGTKTENSILLKAMNEYALLF